MMQPDLFNQPAPEAAKIAAESTPLERDQTKDSPYYVVILNSGYRITYNKEIRT